MKKGLEGRPLLECGKIPRPDFFMDQIFHGSQKSQSVIEKNISLLL